jgi:Tfp pilus assembly PilM family ATPase
LELSGLLEDLQDRLRPLKAQMFPQQVLIELQDTFLRGQVLRDGAPLPVSLEAPLPALTCREGMPLEREPLGDLIGDLLVNENQQEAYVHAVLPYEAAHWRLIVWADGELPADPESELRRLDPELHLPFSLEEAYLDFQAVPGSPPQMLLVAAPRKLVDGWIEVFSLAGAKLDRLAPAQSCLLAALAAELEAAPPDRLLVLLVPEAFECKLYLFHQGLPVFERSLPMGGEDLVDELRRCLAFYHRQQPGLRSLQLLITAELSGQELVEAALGVPARQLQWEPFGSLLLQGLAAQRGLVP